jgi:hypothetical protein
MGIILRPPYTSETCEGEGRALDRIKQVVKIFFKIVFLCIKIIIAVAKYFCFEYQFMLCNIFRYLF